jgi:hypothetical protein
MTVTCHFCDRKIRNPDTADLCLGSHGPADEPLTLHDTCPCPVHAWDAEREYLVREDG